MSPFHFRAPAAEIPEEAVIIPAGIKSKSDLFHVLKTAIPLPSYFGNNWDALEECLRDSDWFPRTPLVLAHEDLPMVESPSEQKIYLEILAGAAARHFQVIFPESARTFVERLLSDQPRHSS